jgi:hypothetical protein
MEREMGRGVIHVIVREIISSDRETSPHSAELCNHIHVKPDFQ